jgi:uncharacterized phage protein (TIGR01671 family)
MNREIKFRIWSNSMKRWLCEDSQYLQMDGKKVQGAAWSTMEWDIPSEQYIIQQYTGLKDNNGDQIYEGDIVQNMIIGPVEYFLGEFSIGGVTPLKDFLIIPRDENQPLNLDLDLEIIGNIFENPELLKQ